MSWLAAGGAPVIHPRVAGSDCAAVSVAVAGVGRLAASVGAVGWRLTVAFGGLAGGRGMAPMRHGHDTALARIRVSAATG